MNLMENLDNYIYHRPFFMPPTQFSINYHDFVFHFHAEQWVTISAGQPGLRNQQWSRRAQHHRCEISGSARRSCGPEGAKGTSHASSRTWSYVRVIQVVLVLKAWRSQKTWHCKAGLKFLKKAWKKPLVKVLSSCYGDQSILEILVLWEDHQWPKQL